MYIYTPLCRYRITLYRYVLVFIVPHVDIELEDNKQFISNIPRTLTKLSFYGKVNQLGPCQPVISPNHNFPGQA